MFNLNPSFLNNPFLHNNFFISCKESRIENNRSFYGCFYLGPFDSGQSITIANALRRTLLAELKGIAITAVEIEGALHEYSNIAGIRDSVLDILLNLKEIVLKKNAGLNISSSCNIENKTTHIGYLRVRGPGVVRASDLKLPASIQSVDSEQYIATLSEDGVLNMKFYMNEGKNYIIQTPKRTIDLNKIPAALNNALFNILPIDAVFMPVNKVNYIIEPNEQLNDFYSVLTAAQSQNLATLCSSGDTNPTSDTLDMRYNGIYQKRQTNPMHVAMHGSATTTPKYNKADIAKATFLKNRKEVKPTLFNGILYYNKKTALKNENRYLAQKCLEMKTLKGFNIKHNIVLEIWTNGSIHPRQALYDSFKSLVTMFSKLYKIKMLGSMFKSDITYTRLLQNNYGVTEYTKTPISYKTNDPLKGLDNFTKVNTIPKNLLNYSSIGSLNSLKKLYLKNSRVSKKESSQDKGHAISHGIPRALHNGYKNNQAILRNSDKIKQALSPVVPYQTTKEIGSLNVPISKTLKTSLTQSKRNIKNVLQLDIGSLNMPLRPYTCLKKANLNTVEDVLKCSKKQLLEIQNFGKRSLQEVEKSLAELGFELLN